VIRFGRCRWGSLLMLGLMLLLILMAVGSLVAL
jgi:hypothetical protein